MKAFKKIPSKANDEHTTKANNLIIILDKYTRDQIQVQY